MATTHDLTLIRRCQRVPFIPGTPHRGHGAAHYVGRINGTPVFRCGCGDTVYVADDQLAGVGFRVAR